MHRRGVLQYVDAVGLHGFASASEFPWQGWQKEVGNARERLNQLGVHPEVWITQTGFSTWRGVERAQAQAFVDAIDSPVERVYWQGIYDSDPLGIPDSLHSDEREYHYGLKRADDSPKLLFQLWSEGGLTAVRDAARTSPRSVNGGPKRHVLITGGCGFIGTNLAHRLLSTGHSVLVYDNLSRPGSETNLSWLREIHGKRVQVAVADVRDRAALQAAVRGAEQVFHFAAQVAVTTSLVNPREDFEVNVGGTVNLLEAIRAADSPPSLVFTSTNKVYGALPGLNLERSFARYQPLDAALRTGISEDCPLDFHSPYGCSKGAADQYVLDYARTFQVPALVFRMSCIYGTHQRGTEDQGWVAHFLITALERRPLILYGDGMQVRDLLFIDDLVDAFLLAQANCQTLAGQAFNIGGGLGNTASLLELVDLIAALMGERPDIRMGDWRPGDQRYYVSDIHKFKSATGWAPKVSIREGVERLYRWLLQSRGLPAANPAELDRNQHAILTH
jgi:CDP-paratose 2-epimerase